MARSCACEKWLRRTVSDAAFRVLPAAVRHLWLDLVAYASSSETPGRFRFPASVVASVSLLVSLPETDVQTHLETLADLDLIEFDADGRTLWMAGARDNAARAEAARINGNRGGRPRKGETLEAARARRQQPSFLLPIVGSGAVAETQETESEPRAESSRVATAKPLEEEAKQAARGTDLVSIGTELADAAGFDGATGGFNFLPVRVWLERGATRELLLHVINQVASRPGYADRRVRSFAYFNNAVIEAIEAGVTGKPDPTSGYAEAMRRWHADGMQGDAPERAAFARAA